MVSGRCYVTYLQSVSYTTVNPGQCVKFETTFSHTELYTDTVPSVPYIVRRESAPLFKLYYRVAKLGTMYQIV